MSELGSSPRAIDLEMRIHRLESAISGCDAPEEPSLQQLFLMLRRGWKLIALSSLIGGLIGSAIALWLPNEYRATAVLMPSARGSVSSLSRLASQFSGIAALAGVSLSSGGDEDKAVIAMELLKSWDFLGGFIRENELDVQIFAAKGWDRDGNLLVIDSDLYDVSQGRWVRKRRGVVVPPTSWELYRKFARRVSVSQDRKTGLIKLSVEYFSPILAKQWVDKLVVAVNTKIQAQDREDASRSIQFLEEKLKETSLSEMRQVFSRLIEEQTKNLMLTDISDEYAIRTISPAMIPEQKSKPHRMVIILAGGIFGCIAGTIACMIHFARRNRIIDGGRPATN